MSKKLALLCKCKSCGYLHNDMPFGPRFENSFEDRRFCSSCGKSLGWDSASGYWTSNSVWWNPATWGSGFWTEVGKAA